MSGFFDPPPSTGTNRAATKDCPTCEGHRLIEVEDDVYGRCPECNAAPTVERAPVSSQSWWKDKL